MTDFYREADGLLTGRQIKGIREALHLTQSQAAEIFGGGKNAFTKYENGDVTQSSALDKLIRTAYAVPAAFHFLSKCCPSITSVEYNHFESGAEVLHMHVVAKTRTFTTVTNRRLEHVGKVVIDNFLPELTTDTVNWQIARDL